MSEVERKFREFVVRGKVYSGNVSHAEHSVYWALNSGEYDGDFLIDEIKIEDDK